MSKAEAQKLEDVPPLDDAEVERMEREAAGEVEPQPQAETALAVAGEEVHPTRVLWKKATNNSEEKWINVPQTTDDLLALLEWSKQITGPVPFRASFLRPELQDALYLVGGVPRSVPPGQLLIFAGLPYPTAEGVVNAALEHPRVDEVMTELVGVYPCADPQSGCMRGEDLSGFKSWQNMKVGQLKTVIYSATVLLRDGERNKRFRAQHSACPHTTGSDRIAKVAQTRALRTVLLPIIGMTEPDHEPDAPTLEDASSGALPPGTTNE